MVDSPTYDKLSDTIQGVIQKSIERDAILNGRHLRDELLDALWPEIQDLLVAAWHAKELWDALGMTEDEYAKWVENHG